MLELFKLLVLFLIVIIVYIEPLFQRNTTDLTKFNTKISNSTTQINKLNTSNEIHQTEHVKHETEHVKHETEHVKHEKKHIRHKRENKMDKSLKFYFSNRERLKKKFPSLFEDLDKKFLRNICPDSVKLTDSERLGECLTRTIEDEIHNIYDRERDELEKQLEIGKLPGIIQKLEPNVQGGMAEGDLPIFHKLLKYRYFKKLDEFSLEFFHRLPLIIKNEIRNYFMFKFKGGYDVCIHERIQYLEEKVDEWILKCANHTRMGLIGQDAYYEEEFLHELSPSVGEPHLLYEVTEMNFEFEKGKRENIPFLAY